MNPEYKSITSDFDYLELAYSGTQNVNLDTYNPTYATYEGKITVNHNLGYIPIARIFVDADKDGSWHVWDETNSSGVGAQIRSSPTSTDFVVWSFSSGYTAIPVHYRLYSRGDKAVSSDQLLDKIFLKGSTNITLPTSSIPGRGDTQVIPHPAGETPIFNIQFSLDQIVWYPMGVEISFGPDTSSGPPGGPYFWYYHIKVTASIDANNLTIRYKSYLNTSKTVYVRYVLEYAE